MTLGLRTALPTRSAVKMSWPEAMSLGCGFEKLSNIIPVDHAIDKRF